MCPGSSSFVCKVSSPSQILAVSGKDQFPNLVPHFPFMARICRSTGERKEENCRKETVDMDIGGTICSVYFCRQKTPAKVTCCLFVNSSLRCHQCHYPFKHDRVMILPLF